MNLAQHAIKASKKRTPKEPEKVVIRPALERTIEHKDRLLNLVDAGFSAVQIAKEIPVSPVSIHFYIARVLGAGAKEKLLRNGRDNIIASKFCAGEA